ncbi:rho guanine nucleotide exchange factor 39 [Oryzias melastigma]|uniref:Rho guanine nucleotide exchange factor (GEF) 39 n=1 Tax=Oryzias melastigma TaxID=30732 RepID=A0A3B3DVC8_ORYME|nr:rho guanine nucleotide exchange factor 39 [Oryzias melastigma]
MSFSPDVLGRPAGCSIQEQRERWQRKRSRTAKELVQTEQRYCQQLHLITTFFVEILKAKGTLKQNVRESIFSSIKDIQSANQSLLVHLENGYFGKGLAQFCTHLHHYTAYVDNIYNANKVLMIQLKKNKAFRRFKKLQEARPEFNSHKLEDLLQLPVQRIHQYKHFLQDLTANTSPDHPEFEQLSKSFHEVMKVFQRIEDNTRRHENHLQLCRVQKLLKGKRTKIMTAGRWYIREGWLNMVPQKGDGAKPRMFFLFSDMLLQAKRCSPLELTNGEKFVGQHAYPLQDCSVEKVFGHTRSKGGLLSLTFPKAKLLLMSNNQEDLNDWHQNLSAAIRKLQPAATVIHQREDRRGELACNRKRHMPLADATERAQTSPEQDCSVPKRMKESDDAGASAGSSASSCVIL